MKEAAQMLTVVNILRELDPKISIQAVAVLLAIATREGCTLVDVEGITGIPQPTISRCVDMLGEPAGDREPGFRLVKRDRIGRVVHLYLTDKGRKLFGQLRAELR